MNGLCQFRPAADFGLFYPGSATIKHRPIRADVPGILHFFLCLCWFAGKPSGTHQRRRNRRAELVRWKHVALRLLESGEFSGLWCAIRREATFVVNTLFGTPSGTGFDQAKH